MRHLIATEPRALGADPLNVLLCVRARAAVLHRVATDERPLPPPGSAAALEAAKAANKVRRIGADRAAGGEGERGTALVAGREEWSGAAAASGASSVDRRRWSPPAARRRAVLRVVCCQDGGAVRDARSSRRCGVRRR